MKGFERSGRCESEVGAPPRDIRKLYERNLHFTCESVLILSCSPIDLFWTASTREMRDVKILAMTAVAVPTSQGIPLSEFSPIRAAFRPSTGMLSSPDQNLKQKVEPLFSVIDLRTTRRDRHEPCCSSFLEPYPVLIPWPPSRTSVCLKNIRPMTSYR